MRIAGSGIDQDGDGGEWVRVGVGPAFSEWNGLRSEEPWQVCMAEAGTALGSPSSSEGLQQEDTLTQTFWALPWHFPRHLVPQGLGGGVVPPDGSGAVLQVLVALRCSLLSSERLHRH